MNKIVQILMDRDGYSEDEAKQMVADARDKVYEGGEDPVEILEEEFGLEPDYIDDLL